jgi:D-amino peptidase
MKLRFALLSSLAMCWLLLPAHSQQRPLKVVVLYDMEGTSGISGPKATRFGMEGYEQGRTSLTADVNAAIAGLKAAGATEIVVVDGHGSGNTSGPDVLEEQLLAPAKMIARDTPFDIYIDSYDHSVDAIVAIAMHAGAGNRAGFLSHTYASLATEYRVNGVPLNESMVLALGAARLKIPLIMVSGDDQLEKEIRRNLPWVRYATIKHAVDRSKAEPLPRQEASRRIETAAREALQKLDAVRLPEFPGPYRFALTFQDEAQAQNAALLPGAELLPGGLSVQVRSNDFEEGYRHSVRLIELAGAVERQTALGAAIDAQPNAAAIRRTVNDWVLDRRFNRLPSPPAAPAPPTVKRPYWGAR